MKSVELLHRARLAGYTGGTSALYTLAQTLRVRTVAPLVRFEGLGGEFSQHDFGEVWVTYQDGREEKVHFFASRLKYSRWIEVSLVPDERVETLVRALVEHLAAWGGVPLVTVFDRPVWRSIWGLAWRCAGRIARREGKRRESGGLGEELVLQAAPLSGSRRSRAPAARVARRGEYDAAVAGHRRHAGGPSGRGPHAPAPPQGRAGRSGPARAGERHPDRRRPPRRASLPHAARRDRAARDAVSLSRPRADHRRALHRRSPAATRAGGTLDPARASRAARRRGVWQARARATCRASTSSLLARRRSRT